MQLCVANVDRKSSNVARANAFPRIIFAMAVWNVQIVLTRPCRYALQSAVHRMVFDAVTVDASARNCVAMGAEIVPMDPMKWNLFAETCRRHSSFLPVTLTMLHEVCCNSFIPKYVSIIFMNCRCLSRNSHSEKWLDRIREATTRHTIDR